MLSTETPIHAEVKGPIVPRVRESNELSLVCDPARGGLIVGKMDHHRPILYVNAVSYRGLLDAATMADRLGRSEKGRRWRAAAESIRNAWRKALQTPLAKNDRTYISGIWPSWIASPTTETFVQNLAKRWDHQRTTEGGFREKPLWTYFVAAEAHQWLFAGRGDRAWSTLEWFWANQASPGLYTWWEGEGEENTFGRWEDVRGWVNPPHVTPHYWTAAEILLLQIDMLCYLDESTETPTLVIGAGVPPEWVKQNMAVANISTKIASVDWRWEDGQMRVRIRGQQAPVRLGAAFPPDTTIVIESPTP